MSEGAALADMLSADTELLGFIGSEERIQLGMLSEKSIAAPPLILIAAKEGLPLIESDEGVVAEQCICTIGILADHTLEEILARLKTLLEENFYRCEMVRRIPGPRREWGCGEMTFTKARMRE